VESVEQKGHGFASTEALTDHEAADEMLLMGLRLSEGLDLERLEAVGGVRPSRAAIDLLETAGLVERLAPGEDRAAGFDEIRACLGPGLAPASIQQPRSATRLRATGRGRFILNELVLRLSQGFESARPS
jgi:oxygen-independent coproporphyrinogen-3 oxidase